MIGKHKKIITGLVIFVFGFGIGFLVKNIFEPVKIIPTTSIRENTDQYKFIRPLLALDRSYDTLLPEYQGLNDKIKKTIEDNISSNLISNASVYFIDYKKFGSFTINKDEQYSPASLLKVIILIAYLKQSESNPSLLDQKLVYEKSIAKYLEEVPFETDTELKIDNTYSIRTLINKMIISSDNGAKDLLLSNISDAYLNQVYKDLNLQAPKDNINYTISVKDYSLFFRILYNATYLNQENSEKALSILSQTTFSDGITNTLPNDLVVAHKFGESVNGSKEQINFIELHDCGIIYYPNSPYLLCIMTKGKDFKGPSTVIGEISKIIYDYKKQN